MWASLSCGPRAHRWHSFSLGTEGIVWVLCPRTLNMLSASLVYEGWTCWCWRRSCHIKSRGVAGAEDPSFQQEDSTTALKGLSVHFLVVFQVKNSLILHNRCVWWLGGGVQLCHSNDIFLRTIKITCSTFCIGSSRKENFIETRVSFDLTTTLQSTMWSKSSYDRKTKFD